MPFNAAAALTTPTYDGSGETTHPDIVDFGSDGASPTGKRFVMAHTPYPAGDDDFENPSILHSSDGETWTTPAGITNPIVAFPGGAGFNADTDLAYDDGSFYCFFGQTTDGTDKIIKVTEATYSEAGTTWSESTLFTTVAATSNPVSPTVIKDGATWKMWYVDQADNDNTLCYRTSASPTTGWSAESVLTFTGLPLTRDIWHIDVFKDGDGIYRMILNDTTVDVNGQAGTIRLGSSSDGLTWAVSEALLAASPAGWDNGRIYRSTGFIEGDVLRLWYSGVSSGNAWRLGYTEIPTFWFPDPA